MKYLPTLWSDARGSVGGNTFTRGPFGLVMRSKATPINPNTGRQQAVRNIFSSLAVDWTGELSDIERAAFDLYGQNVTVKNSLGNDIFLTGFNHFIRTNSIVLAAGIDRLDDAPTIFTLAETDDDLAVTASEASQELSIAFDDSLAWANEDDAVLQISMSRPQGAGTRFIKGPFRVAGFIEGDSTTAPTTPATLTAPYFVTEGQVLQVKARILRADGRLSDPFLDTLAAGA